MAHGLLLDAQRKGRDRLATPFSLASLFEEDLDQLSLLSPTFIPASLSLNRSPKVAPLPEDSRFIT